MKKFLNKRNILLFIVLILIYVIASVVFNANKPKYNVFVRTPNLNIARVRHTATLLNDGRVLIVGGDSEIDKNALRTAEVYDPVQNKFILLPNKTNIDHSGSRAFLLKNGKVVILDYNGIELFDPKTNTFKLVSRMLIPRHDFGAVLLKDDRVLIYEGWIKNYAKNRSQDNKYLYESEVYNPINNNSYYVDKTYCIDPKYGNRVMVIPLITNYPVLLQDGKVDFIGEYSNKIYDPANNNFSRQYIPAINKNSIGSAVMLNNQKILIICKDSGNGLIFDPQSQNVYPVPNEKTTTNYIEKYPPKDYGYYKTILLNNGNVLITNNYFLSGFMRFYTPVVKAEIYNPKLNKILPSADMNEKRYQYTATLLKNGNVLYAGGYTYTCYLFLDYKDKRVAKTAELFIP